MPEVVTQTFLHVSSRRRGDGAGSDEEDLHQLQPQGPASPHPGREGGGPRGYDPVLLRWAGERQKSQNVSNPNQNTGGLS